MLKIDVLGRVSFFIEGNGSVSFEWYKESCPLDGYFRLSESGEGTTNYLLTLIVTIVYFDGCHAFFTLSY